MSAVDARREAFTQRATGATRAVVGETVQSLWSGYGSIVRIHLEGAGRTSVILKHIAPPPFESPGRPHPRGWDTDRSYQRKVQSYGVEAAFYTRYASRCGPQCRVPEHLASTLDDDARATGERYLLLQDLDDAGYPERPSRLGRTGVEACLAWLANFHATFMGTAPDALWPVGTYWHLATRSDELDAMDASAKRLKRAAAAIDARLSACRYRTLVHGDAKVANFCFAGREVGEQVAAVDFQYVGGGCGMKDVAYLLWSCLDDAECAREEERHLSTYFAHLRKALDAAGVDVDVRAVEKEWRELFPWAVADFQRFLLGWFPGHSKLGSYSAQITNAVIEKCEGADGGK